MVTCVPVDDALVELVTEDGQDLVAVVREALTLDLYRRGVISGGRAAEILGMEKRKFLRWSGELGIPQVRDSVEEFEAELDALERIVR